MKKAIAGLESCTVEELQDKLKPICFAVMTRVFELCFQKVALTNVLSNWNSIIIALRTSHWEPYQIMDFLKQELQPISVTELSVDNCEHIVEKYFGKSL
jgi:hypothetical protein